MVPMIIFAPLRLCERPFWFPLGAIVAVQEGTLKTPVIGTLAGRRVIPLISREAATGNSYGRQPIESSEPRNAMPHVTGER